jgi:hypothetical protein
MHQAQRTAGRLQVAAAGHGTQEGREGAPTPSALLALTEWLVEPCGPLVYHVLAGTVEVLMGNPQEMQRRPGRKPDPDEARWSAELVSHGLSRPRFILPPALSAWRDLTRTRVALVQTRSQAKHRVYQLLEDTKIKLASGVTELWGTSRRRLRAAWSAGAWAPAAGGAHLGPAPTDVGAPSTSLERSIDGASRPS